MSPTGNLEARPLDGSPICVGCGQEGNIGRQLNWEVFREDVVVQNEEELQDLLERRSGLPKVLVLPDEGGVLVYGVGLFCDGCMNEHLKEYEERHVPPDKVTREEFHQKVVALFRENCWTVYSLQHSYLAPRGFRNLALTKGDHLLLRSVQGDVTVRLRSSHAVGLPGHTLLVSPDAPAEVRELLVRSPEEDLESDSVSFLYMDEKYLAPELSPEMQVTSLTGLLVPADVYPHFRDRLLRLSPRFDRGPKDYDTEIHAGDLFRDLSDEEHFAFYSGLVSLVNELGCRIYRRGFNFIPGDGLLRKKQSDLIGICFTSMLIAVHDFEPNTHIWPVMEVDHTKVQDRNFAGYVRWLDSATAHLQMTGDGVEELIDADYMVDNTRLGDLHYVSKESVVGSAADCLVYLLHCRWLNERGFKPDQLQVTTR